MESWIHQGDSKGTGDQSLSPKRGIYESQTQTNGISGKADGPADRGAASVEQDQ